MDINWLDANYLPWLIPVPPLLSFLLIVLATGKDKKLSGWLAVVSVIISFVFAWGVFFHAAFGTEEFGRNAYGSDLVWMDLGISQFRMGVLVDPLGAAMLFMVPLAILMIFVYSVGYMSAYPEDDPHQTRFSRFFAYLSLFAGGMLTLVVADNLLLLFIGWEIMGLCSYLLIGFLIEKKSAYQAAVKAFMTTRVADVLMLVGIGYLFVETGSLNFRHIMYDHPDLLERLGDAQATGFLGLSAAAIIGTFLVIGTIGKSAQFPLHAWLPDAMEGPTPVSAMIHAAAMVSAGVYMVIRMFPLLEAGGNPHIADYPLPLIVMGIIGSITALGAASLGIAQNDIKRVLAYSTISQLGFMVAALGIGAYVAAAFHLIIHAFFKALLFMSSGAVIHAMEHGEQHVKAAGGHVPHRVQPGEATPYGTDYIGPHGEAPPPEEWRPTLPGGITLDFVAVPNDMMYMGGLWKKIPVTAFTMLAGAASLAGLPFVSAGFWSKDEIIADAMLFLTNNSEFEGNAPWLHIIVFICLTLAAVCTAFYTARMWLLTFWGEPRSEMAEHATLKHEHHHGYDAAHSHEHHEESHALVTYPEVHPVEHHRESSDSITFDFKAWWSVYRNSALMQGPLVILAFFAITAGWVGIHKDFWGLHLLTASNNFFHEFVGPTLFHEPPTIHWTAWPVLVSMVAFLGGAGLGYLFYRVPLKAGEKDPMNVRFGDTAWAVLQNRFHLDTLFLMIFYTPFEWFARKVAYLFFDKELIDETLHSIGDFFVWVGEAVKRFNRVVIDGVGDGIPIAIWNTGKWFRNLQSGRVQQYLLFSALAMIVIVIGAFLVL